MHLLPDGSHIFQVGDFAHHVEAGDGLFIYEANEDFSVCTSVAVAEVTDIDLAAETCTIDKRNYTGVVEPDKGVRWRWQRNPYLCPDAKKVEKYGMVQFFADAFSDPKWLQRPMGDAVQEVFRPDLSKPTLMPVVGHVYVFQSSTHYKIGKSVEVDERIKQVGKDVGEELRLLHTINTNDYTRTETELHLRYAHCRVRGEWFDLSPDELAEILAISEVTFERKK